MSIKNKRNVGESGVRLAISYAINDGNAELAHSALDFLWKYKEHRNWFKFKFPILVLTKALYLFPMYVEFMKRKSEEDKKQYEKFLSLLTVCKKDDRVEKMYNLVSKPQQSNEYKNELALQSRYFLGLSNADEYFTNESAIDKMIVDDEYNQGLSKEICGLINRGGTQADKHKCYIGILALAIQGWTKNDIHKKVKNEMKKIPKKIIKRKLTKTFLRSVSNDKKNKSN